ncbi:MAG: M48 family metallopeptidase [Kiloniellales bacterium]
MTTVIAGNYADGQTARLHPVQVHLESTGLAIVDAEGARLALWAYEELEPAEAVQTGRPVRLRLRDDKGARLTIEPETSLEALWQAAPQLRGRRRMGRRAWRAVAVMAASVGAVGVGLVYGVPRLADALTVLVPVSWEEATGSAIQREVIGLFVEDAAAGPICAAAAGRAALDRLTQRVAAPIETDFSFTVTVANSKTVNAFALPGGYIVVLSGLIDLAESPDEVAAVLAHEMAHVVERHPTRGMIRNTGHGILIDVLLGGSVAPGWASSMGQMLITTSYTREDEAEADALGADFLKAAGLRTGGDIRFFERLKEKFGDMPQALAMFSSHPLTEDRIAALRERASDGDDALGDSEWQALRTICDETTAVE